MPHTEALKDATATLRMIAKRLEARAFEESGVEAAQFFDALDALLAKAAIALPRWNASIEAGESDRHSTIDESIQRSLRISHETMEGAPIGIFRLDSEGRLVSANQAACQSLGYEIAELLQRTIFDIAPDMTPEIWRAHRAQTKVTGSRTLLSTHRRKDGTLYPVEVFVKQFVFQGELYSVSFVKDITERVVAEQERRKMESRMLAAQKLESLGVLAGGIAHDFNNLLMAMIGNLDLAFVALSPVSDGRPLLQEVDKAARQAADLCRQLLIYAGKGVSEVQPVDLGRLLREQAQMLEVSAAKSARLVLALAEGVPLIQADVSQLRQIFMNLIINASDAIGEAPGVITITTHAMDCDGPYLEGGGFGEGLKPGRYVSVEVTDTGCGMTEAIREKIFDPFFSTKTAGRGLGLAAVRGIVHNHGGGIRVYSEPGKGTTFKLLFPLPDVLTPAQAAPPVAKPWQGKGLVLLVDDEPALRRLGVRMLTRLGFESLTAQNGIEALAMYRQHRDRIRYVLLDWSMPEMGGDETFVELRRIDPKVRVVLTSGHPPEEIMRRLTGNPVTAFVRKPYVLTELAEAFRAASAEP